MILLTKKDYESYLNQTQCHIYEKKFQEKYTNDKCYAGKHRGPAHNTRNLPLIAHLKKFQWFFTMVETTIIILS